MPGLIGFVGIDILINYNKIYIVEINPRLTTSYVGLYETIGCNMIDLLQLHDYLFPPEKPAVRVEATSGVYRGPENIDVSFEKPAARV